MKQFVHIFLGGDLLYTRRHWFRSLCCTLYQPPIRWNFLVDWFKKLRNSHNIHWFGGRKCRHFINFLNSGTLRPGLPCPCGGLRLQSQISCTLFPFLHSRPIFPARFRRWSCFASAFAPLLPYVRIYIPPVVCGPPPSPKMRESFYPCQAMLCTSEAGKEDISTYFTIKRWRHDSLGFQGIHFRSQGERNFVKLSYT